MFHRFVLVVIIDCDSNYNDFLGEPVLYLEGMDVVSLLGKEFVVPGHLADSVSSWAWSQSMLRPSICDGGNANF